MKFKLNIFNAVAILLFTVQCSNSQQTQVHPLKANEFNAKIKQEGIVLIDVRTDEEVAQGKIKGATQINFNASNFDKKMQALDKDKTYLVYCASGGRSNKATNKMTDLGFKDVFDLDGGIKAWKSAGLPLD